MRILLTGAKGQLGLCLKDRIPENWELIATDSKTLNIADADAVMKMAKSFEPDIIINAAAYTAVDKAQSEAERAFAVNAQGTLNIALAAQAVKARFIHVSSDYVFDGEAKTPYRETDSPNPQSAYGQSKLAGELLALSNVPHTVIVRTSWVYSEYGHNFVKTMLKLGQERDELNIVGDQFGCPTYAGDLAQAIIAIILKPDFKPGIYHYCGNSPMTWFEFTQAIFNKARKTGMNLNCTTVNKITTDQFPTPAKRPHYSILDTQKIQAALNLPQDFKRDLDHVIEALSAQ